MSTEAQFLAVIVGSTVAAFVIVALMKALPGGSVTVIYCRNCGRNNWPKNTRCYACGHPFRRASGASGVQELSARELQARIDKIKSGSDYRKVKPPPLDLD